MMARGELAGLGRDLMGNGDVVARAVVEAAGADEAVVEVADMAGGAERGLGEADAAEVPAGVVAEIALADGGDGDAGGEAGGEAAEEAAGER